MSPSLGQDFMLSVAQGNNGLERVFVGANNRNGFCCHCCRAFDCQHCITVQQWVQTQDGTAMELCEVFISFSLQSAEQQVARSQSSSQVCPSAASGSRQATALSCWQHGH